MKGVRKMKKEQKTKGETNYIHIISENMREQDIAKEI